MHTKNAPLVSTALLLAACATTGPFAEDLDPGALVRAERRVPADEPSPTAAAPEPGPLVLVGAGAPDYLSPQGPPPQGQPQPPQGGPPRAGQRRWSKGRPLMQGLFGATVYEKIETSGGNSPSVDGSDDNLSQMPTLAGGAQWKLGGENIDFGLEALLAFSWRSGATAIATGGGGAVVAVDVDLFVFDLYGGPFVSVFLGDSVRVYAAAGPMMQWGDYDQSSAIFQGSGSGFGLGYYARTGLEFEVGSGTMIGAGVRWSDSKIDLDGGQGDLDLAGFQLAVTFSYFY